MLPRQNSNFVSGHDLHAVPRAMPEVSRRGLFRSLAGAGLCAFGVLNVAPALAAEIANTTVRRLKLHHAHTGETVWTTYYIAGEYVPEALDEIDFILRDIRAPEQLRMGVELVELLSLIQRKLETTDPLTVTSGYRTRETNKTLRKRGHGAAKNSLHMSGKAVDFFVENRSIRQLSRLARTLKMGGVGTYNSYVHVDVGPVRTWSAG